MQSFATRAELESWLKVNHAKSTELWVRIYKRASGRKSVDWKDCVEAGLAWGWIDGIRRAHDADSFLQRMTPRRPRSMWSKRNCETAELLIREGRMSPAGLAQVAAAKEDGRWERAYGGRAEMVIPDDFLKALRRNAAAQRAFKGLNRTGLFRIYHRLQTAKTEGTRVKRIEALIRDLAESAPTTPGKRMRRASP